MAWDRHHWHIDTTQVLRVSELHDAYGGKAESGVRTPVFAFLLYRLNHSTGLAPLRAGKRPAFTKKAGKS